MLDQTEEAQQAASRFPDMPLLFAVTTTAFAGFLDAIGYMQLSGLYVSFMSGNSTRLGVDLAQGNMAVVFQSGCVIAVFVLGAFAGTVIASQFDRPSPAPILAAEFGLVAIALLLTQAQVGFAALLPVAAAMGLQNVLHHTVSGADLGKSFLTGTLFGIGQALAHYVCRKGRAAVAIVQLACWLAFVAGVVGGALVITSVSLRDALLLALLLLALVAVIAKCAIR